MGQIKGTPTVLYKSGKPSQLVLKEYLSDSLIADQICTLKFLTRFDGRKRALQLGTLVAAIMSEGHGKVTQLRTPLPHELWKETCMPDWIVRRLEKSSVDTPSYKGALTLLAIDVIASYCKNFQKGGSDE